MIGYMRSQLEQDSPVADLRGARGTRTPPRGPNSFNFMQFLGKFGKFVCWRPLLGEILDPPLFSNILSPFNKEVSIEYFKVFAFLRGK